MEEHESFAAAMFDMLWTHHPAAGRGPVAGVDVDVLGTQTRRTVIPVTPVTQRHDPRPAVLAGESLVLGGSVSASRSKKESSIGSAGFRSVLTARPQCAAERFPGLVRARDRFTACCEAGLVSVGVQVAGDDGAEVRPVLTRSATPQLTHHPTPQLPPSVGMLPRNRHWPRPGGVRGRSVSNCTGTPVASDRRGTREGCTGTADSKPPEGWRAPDDAPSGQTLSGTAPGAGTPCQSSSPATATAITAAASISSCSARCSAGPWARLIAPGPKSTVGIPSSP